MDLKKPISGGPKLHPVVAILIVIVLLAGITYISTKTIFKPKVNEDTRTIGFDKINDDFPSATEAAKKKGETKGSTSQVVSKYTPNTKSVPTLTPKPPSIVSAALFYKKIDQHNEISKHAGNFIGSGEYQLDFQKFIKSLDISLLDKAQEALELGKSYNAKINTTGNPATQAYAYCLLADQYYQDSINELRSSLLSKDYDQRNKFITSWGNFDRKGLGQSQLCLNMVNLYK